MSTDIARDSNIRTLTDMTVRVERSMDSNERVPIVSWDDNNSSAKLLVSQTRIHTTISEMLRSFPETPAIYAAQLKSRKLAYVTVSPEIETSVAPPDALLLKALVDSNGEKRAAAFASLERRLQQYFDNDFSFYRGMLSAGVDVAGQTGKICRICEKSGQNPYFTNLTYNVMTEQPDKTIDVISRYLEVRLSGKELVEELPRPQMIRSVATGPGVEREIEQQSDNMCEIIHRILLVADEHVSGENFVKFMKFRIGASVSGNDAGKIPINFAVEYVCAVMARIVVLWEDQKAKRAPKTIPPVSMISLQEIIHFARNLEKTASQMVDHGQKIHADLLKTFIDLQGKYPIHSQVEKWLNESGSSLYMYFGSQFAGAVSGHSALTRLDRVKALTDIREYLLDLQPCRLIPDVAVDIDFNNIRDILESRGIVVHQDDKQVFRFLLSKRETAPGGDMWEFFTTTMGGKYNSDVVVDSRWFFDTLRAMNYREFPISLGSIYAPAFDEISMRHHMRLTFEHSVQFALERLKSAIARFTGITKFDGMVAFSQNTAILSDRTIYSSVSIKTPIVPHPPQIDYVKFTLKNMLASSDRRTNRPEDLVSPKYRISANDRSVDPIPRPNFESLMRNMPQTQIIRPHHRKLVAGLIELGLRHSRTNCAPILYEYFMAHSVSQPLKYGYNKNYSVSGEFSTNASNFTIFVHALWKALDIGHGNGAYDYRVDGFAELVIPPEFVKKVEGNSGFNAAVESLVRNSTQTHLNAIAEQFALEVRLFREDYYSAANAADDENEAAYEIAFPPDAVPEYAENLARGMLYAIFFFIIYVRERDAPLPPDTSVEKALKYNNALPGAGKTTTPLIAAAAIKKMKAALGLVTGEGKHYEIVFVCDFTNVLAETYARACEAGLNVSRMCVTNNGMRIESNWLVSRTVNGKLESVDPGFKCPERDIFIMDSKCLIFYVLYEGSGGNRDAYVFVDEFAGQIGDFEPVNKLLQIGKSGVADAKDRLTTIYKKFFPALLLMGKCPSSITLSGASMVSCQKIREAIINGRKNEDISHEILSRGKIYVTAQYRYAWGDHVNMWNVCPQEQFGTFFDSIWQPLYRRTVGHHAAILIRDTIRGIISDASQPAEFKCLAEMQNYLDYDLGEFTGETVAEYTIGLLYFIMLYSTRYLGPSSETITCGEMQAYMRNGPDGPRQLLGANDRYIKLPPGAPWPKSRFLFRDECGFLYPEIKSPAFLRIFGIASSWARPIPISVEALLSKRYVALAADRSEAARLSPAAGLLGVLRCTEIGRMLRQPLSVMRPILDVDSTRCCTTFDRIRHALVRAYFYRNNVTIVLDSNPQELAVAIVASIIEMTPTEVKRLAQDTLGAALEADQRADALAEKKKKQIVTSMKGQGKQNIANAVKQAESDANERRGMGPVGGASWSGGGTSAAEIGQATDSITAEYTRNAYTGNIYSDCESVFPNDSDYVNAYLLACGIMCFSDDDQEFQTQMKFDYLKNEGRSAKIYMVIGTTRCAYGINVKDLTVTIVTPRACLMTGTNTISQFNFRAGRSGMSDDASLFTDSLTLLRMTESATHSIDLIERVHQAGRVGRTNDHDAIPYTRPTSATFVKFSAALDDFVSSRDYWKIALAIDKKIIENVLAMIEKGGDCLAARQRFSDLLDSAVFTALLNSEGLLLTKYDISGHFYTMLKFIIAAVQTHLHEPFGISSVLSDEYGIPPIVSHVWPRSDANRQIWGSDPQNLKHQFNQMLIDCDAYVNIANSGRATDNLESLQQFSDAHMMFSALQFVLKRFVFTVDDVNFDQFSEIASSALNDRNTYNDALISEISIDIKDRIEQFLNAENSQGAVRHVQGPRVERIGAAEIGVMFRGLRK